MPLAFANHLHSNSKSQVTCSDVVPTCTAITTHSLLCQPCTLGLLLSLHPVSCALSFRCGLDVTDSCQRWPGFTPWLSPPLHTAAWETTGHQAGASLYGLEQGSRPNQYLCISCPFAQVSSLIITAWRSFNVLAGWAKGRGCVTFPRPWVDLDHIHGHGDRHNKAIQMTLLLILDISSCEERISCQIPLKKIHSFAAVLISRGTYLVEHHFETFSQLIWSCSSIWQTPTTSGGYDFSFI